jgi:hypothetical protein
MSEARIDPRAGQEPEPADLVDVERLLAAYHEERPDPSDPLQHVGFGTSGHRGSSLSGTFTDAHGGVEVRPPARAKSKQRHAGQLAVEEAASSGMTSSGTGVDKGERAATSRSSWASRRVDAARRVGSGLVPKRTTSSPLTS